MNHNIVFREPHSAEEDIVCKIVIDSFNEFIAPGYSSEGISEFNNYVQADVLRKRLRNGSYSFVAIDKDRIVGVIEVRDINHISLLFVKNEYHKMGIARKLVELALDRAKLLKPSINVIEVNSSPYGAKIYEHIGFISIDVEQVVHGIKFIPMKLTLNNK